VAGVDDHQIYRWRQIIIFVGLQNVAQPLFAKSVYY